MPHTSLLEETKWYWRQGLKRLPIHGGREDVQEHRTRELYTAVSDEAQAQKMVQELSQKGIKISSKRKYGKIKDLYFIKWGARL